MASSSQTLPWPFKLSSLCRPPGGRTVCQIIRDPPALPPIVFAGAHNRIRTDDLALTKGVLCQLSYVGGIPFCGRLRQPSIICSPYDRTFSCWCQGQDSNLRSPSGQRFYRPSVLATHPPWQDSSGPYTHRCQRRDLLEPEGGFEPSTYRLQIGCAAVAPLGHASSKIGKAFRA